MSSVDAYEFLIDLSLVVGIISICVVCYYLFNEGNMRLLPWKKSDKKIQLYVPPVSTYLTNTCNIIATK